MRRLDFISGSPQLSIFREDANKTNLGGTIYLIYLIILLLLAIIYFYDYFNNDRYDFNYNYVKESYSHQEINEGIYEDIPELNADLEVMFDLKVDNIRSLNPYHFLILDLNSNEWLLLNKTYTKNTGNFTIAVFYYCEDENCIFREEDKLKEGERSYVLNMYYKGYSLEHQDPVAPIKKMDEFILKPLEFLSNTYICYLNWELIEYEEEKGIFGKYFDKMKGKESTYYGGDFKSTEYYLDDGRLRTLWYKNLLSLLYLEVHTNQLQHDKYTRKAASVLDVLADVTALASTALDLMSLAYGFCYSSNYDNYKIVENILSKKMKIHIKNDKIEDNKEFQIELTDNLINDNKSLERIENDEKTDIEKNLNEKQKSKKDSINLPLMKFYDFCIHQFYFKCFGHSIKQSLIESCNDIVSKYMTIESLLYNQIKLENLLKDYKWNNPQYEINEKHDFLLELNES